MRCLKRMENTSWIDLVTNEEVFRRGDEERNILHVKQEGWLAGLVICGVRAAFQNMLLKER